jgi:type I pantothenate kinase
VSDFFDFSIYIDAADGLIEDWYVERFLRLRQTAFRDPASYFHRFATLSEEQARAIGLSLWQTINLVNLTENILPTRQRADLILRKGKDHAVETVALRKL